MILRMMWDDDYWITQREDAMAYDVHVRDHGEEDENCWFCQNHVV